MVVVCSSVDDGQGTKKGKEQDLIVDEEYSPVTTNGMRAERILLLRAVKSKTWLTTRWRQILSPAGDHAETDVKEKGSPKIRVQKHKTANTTTAAVASYIVCPHVLPSRALHCSSPVACQQEEHADPSLPWQDYDGLLCLQIQTVGVLSAAAVKCDETRPTCKNCCRRKEECRFPGGDSSTGTTPPGNNANGANFAAQIGLQSHPFDGLDLALMHHYSTVTSVHLFPSDGGRHVWQGIVPEKAQLSSGKILQHGMLALSAMELACQCATSSEALPAQVVSYRARGLHHQQAGIVLFRGLLSSENPADRNAAFIFSLMLIILAFSSAHSATAKPSLEEILDVFALMRGPRTLWQMHNDPLNAELIETMSPERNKPSPASPKEDITNALASLPLDETSKEAIGVLIAAWTRFDVERQDVRAIALLPALASDPFRDQVRQRHPDALEVLVHYAKLLSRFRSRWWVGPWDEFLLEAIEAASPSLMDSIRARRDAIKV